MKVLLIGPFPYPINGCSYANKVLQQNLERKSIHTSTINTNIAFKYVTHGNFSLKKIASFIHVYAELYKIFFAKIVYVTPGQTFFGVCKYAPFLILCRILKKNYIIHLHGDHLGKEYEKLKTIRKKIFFFLISGASAGIVLSESLRSNFEKLLPFHKIYVVENFVDELLIHLPLNKNTVTLRILYLSNVIREKGILELLDGLLLLQHKKLNFQARIAGAIEEGINQEFDKRLQLLGQQIQYLGVVTGVQKQEVLMEANVLVLPTYYKMEGQPICLLEGMATGNIIITTAHAGIPDIMDESHGFFIKKQSPEDIADCFEKICMNLPRMIDTFSSYNRNYVAHRFTEANFTNKISAIIYAIAET